MFHMTIPHQPLFCLPHDICGYVYFVHILSPGQDNPLAETTSVSPWVTLNFRGLIDAIVRTQSSSPSLLM